MNMYKHCKMDKHYTLTQLTCSFSFCLSTLNRFHLKIVSQWQRQLKHLSGLIHIKYSRSDLPLKFQHHHPNVALLFNSTKLISFSLTKSIKICCRKSHNNSSRDDNERILKKIWKKIWVDDIINVISNKDLTAADAAVTESVCMCVREITDT